MASRFPSTRPIQGNLWKFGRGIWWKWFRHRLHRLWGQAGWRKRQRKWGNKQWNKQGFHHFFKVFGEQTVDLIVEETNQYAHQSLRNNPSHLATWKNVSKEELKAYFGVCMIMGINQLPRIADYWKDDLGNTGIKQKMTRNRFQEISQFLHFTDSTRTPAHGKNVYDQLYKVRLVLNAVLENSQRCYSPTNILPWTRAWLLLKADFHFDNICWGSRQNMALKCGWLWTRRMAT